MIDPHSPQELAIFTRFAKASPLAIDLERVEKRNPPEPDIRCALQNGTPLAFEMVRVVDPVVMKTTSLALAFPTWIHAALEETVPDVQSAIAARFEHFEVVVSFRPDAMMREQRDAVSQVIQILKSAPETQKTTTLFEGEVGDVLRSVEAVRYQSDDVIGPGFYTPGGTSYRDDPSKPVLSKFGKTYQVDCPLHLLAHFELTEPLGEWTAAARRFVEDQIDESPFESVWFYDYTSDTAIRLP